MAEAGEYGVFIVSRVSYLIINYVAGDELDLEYCALCGCPAATRPLQYCTSLLNDRYCTRTQQCCTLRVRDAMLVNGTSNSNSGFDLSGLSALFNLQADSLIDSYQPAEQSA